VREGLLWGRCRCAPTLDRSRLLRTCCAGFSVEGSFVWRSTCDFFVDVFHGIKCPVSKASFTIINVFFGDSIPAIQPNHVIVRFLLWSVSCVPICDISAHLNWYFAVVCRCPCPGTCGRGVHHRVRKPCVCVVFNLLINGSIERSRLDLNI